MDNKACKSIDLNAIRQKPSVIVSTKDAISDIEPVKWSNEVRNGYREAVIINK